ncbi:suppressor of cytokine signaling 2 [Nephila pilipes]|uniref:Suppressor of cytokine signaling 2 n=1 Tax=Nephila pilipes TaxID=299642 RepID=A0A8X6UAQ6_NEPPI|nr:suppressor of cytokine signaling 2 [Nephila pilipes]
MLTSCQFLDSTFSNPVVDTCTSLSDSSSALNCFHETWSCPPINAPRTAPNPSPKDCTTKRTDDIKPPKAAMIVEPEDDLNILINNDCKLGLCGYYYGNLSWVSAAHLLKHCKVGTFLVRDSEHGSYLYTLSVQTRKGPTSCRIEYVDGRFRLDSSKNLSHKMPLFDCVPSLIDNYVQARNQVHKVSKDRPAVWLDMDEENTMDVPVQICKPLYRQVRSLQHMCRVRVVKNVRDSQHSQTNSRTEDKLVPLSRTMREEPQYKNLPNIIKDYLIQYPYSQ